MGGVDVLANWLQVRPEFLGTLSSAKYGAVHAHASAFLQVVHFNRVHSPVCVQCYLARPLRISVVAFDVRNIDLGRQLHALNLTQRLCRPSCS